MNLHTLLNQFTGTTNPDNLNGQSIRDKLGQTANLIPGGLASGAMAGGIMALLIGNKSARKFAGTAATYGGAALLGGLAYKAYKNWQQSNHHQTTINENSFTSDETISTDFQLTLLKGMIAAAQADGHIDATEQQRILHSIEKMELSTGMKTLLFDLLRQPITVNELAHSVTSMEQKTELYLVSCLIVDPNQPKEKAYLAELAHVLALPAGLTQQLQMQAQQTMAVA
ncbi:MAG: tellurite resistance TerB family protein [Thioalkalispiraceae bacterium]|jgi:uncharacterized membrane protein YebE (DUF533 family)